MDRRPSRRIAWVAMVSRIVSFYLPDDVTEALDRRALGLNQSRSATAAQLLRNCLMGVGGDPLGHDLADGIVTQQPAERRA